ncbi:GDP-L-fucose synthase [Polynucleobacter paneuropaeus]|nr:GDP-L-fucose synthase [Polynucleobacter paneuropaeus]
MNNNFFYKKRIWITGHKGMVGSSLARTLLGFNCELLLATRSELDLLDKVAVKKWISFHKPDLVFHAAAKVGGIYANLSYPAEFIYENLQSTLNVIEAAHESNVKKLIFVATNCTYPNHFDYPIPEHAIFTGAPDDAVRPYAISKIAGIELCRAYTKQYGCNYISVIPPNLYGVGDNYHPENSHVIAGIIQKTHAAKIKNSPQLTIWGDGSPRRELLWVDDLSKAMLTLMSNETKYDLYNIGYGSDLSIAEIAKSIASTVGFEGQIVYDISMPNGVKRKLLDNSRISALGWTPKMHLKDGLKIAYDDFLRNTT